MLIYFKNTTNLVKTYKVGTSNLLEKGKKLLNFMINSQLKIQLLKYYKVKRIIHFYELTVKYNKIHYYVASIFGNKIL